jgi:hypothetical protein
VLPFESHAVLTKYVVYQLCITSANSEPSGSPKGFVSGEEGQ